MSNLSDDVALAASAIAGIARLLVTRGLLRPHHFTVIADRAGMSEAQAAAFARGEWQPAPHQTLTLVVAALERIRAMEVSAAQLRTAQSPEPVTPESVQQAIEALSARFPGWKITVDDLDTVAEFGAQRLVWHATAADKAAYGNYARQTARDEGELAFRIGNVEADLKAEREHIAAYNDGRGVARRR